jgi:hypothetical protein
MNCCDDYGNCRQGRDCPVRTTPSRAVYSFAIRCLAALGAFTVFMFLLGYAYASVPLILPKTCTPSFIDRILK